MFFALLPGDTGPDCTTFFIQDALPYLEVPLRSLQKCAVKQIVILPSLTTCGEAFSRGGFLVRPLGERAYRKRFRGLSWTSSDPLGNSSSVGQMTDVDSQSGSLAVELFPRMLALCLSHQWSKLACCRISNSCYVLALSDPLMRHSLLSGMENEPAHRVALHPGYSFLS